MQQAIGEGLFAGSSFAASYWGRTIRRVFFCSKLLGKDYPQGLLLQQAIGEGLSAGSSFAASYWGRTIRRVFFCSKLLGKDHPHGLLLQQAFGESPFAVAAKEDPADSPSPIACCKRRPCGLSFPNSLLQKEDPANSPSSIACCNSNSTEGSAKPLKEKPFGQTFKKKTLPPRAKGPPRDRRTRGPADQRTTGPKDQGTSGPENWKTNEQGAQEPRNQRPEDQRTRPKDQGPRDQRTSEPRA